mgnify:CR=1 FL=1
MRTFLYLFLIGFGGGLIFGFPVFICFLAVTVFLMVGRYLTNTMVGLEIAPDDFGSEPVTIESVEAKMVEADLRDASLEERDGDLPIGVKEAFKDWLQLRLEDNGNEPLNLRSELIAFALWHGPENLDRGILKPTFPIGPPDPPLQETGMRNHPPQIAAALALLREVATRWTPEDGEPGWWPDLLEVVLTHAADDDSSEAFGILEELLDSKPAQEVVDAVTLLAQTFGWSEGWYSFPPASWEVSRIERLAGSPNETVH